MVCDRRESIGFVHSSSHSAQNMIIDEDNASRNIALIFRAVLLLWSIPSARLLGVALGREVGDSSISMQDMATAGMFGSVLGGMWLVIWVTDVFLLWVDALVSWHGGCPRGRGQWWNAFWCTIRRWASFPPKWRVEDSYVPASVVGVGSKRL
eukprot:CCRYP_009050-RA/>CCRYP_009050-RA protein AED:0.28 eAED:0.23 QI:0/0/0/1/0/0/2/0/151